MKIDAREHVKRVFSLVIKQTRGKKENYDNEECFLALLFITHESGIFMKMNFCAICVNDVKFEGN